MTYDPSLEYPAMLKCPKWNGCSALCCPLDPNLEHTEVRDGRECGRHWYVEYDEVCANRSYWQHPMVRAQRRIVKNTKPAHLDHESSVAELIHLGTKKRKAPPQAIAALAEYREKKRSGIARMGKTSTQILETGCFGW